MQSTLRTSGSIGGANMTGSISREAEGAIAHDPVAEMGYAGTVSNVSAQTMDFIADDASHGLVDGDTVMYLGDDGTIVYSGTVGAVSGATIPVTTLVGTMPANTDKGKLSKQYIIDTDFNSDLLQMMGVRCAAPCVCLVFDDTPTKLVDIVTSVNEAWNWYTNYAGFANPLGTDNDIDYMIVAQFGTTRSETINVGVLYDSVS